MSRFSVRLEDAHEEMLKDVPGNAKNKSVLYLIETYAKYQGEIKRLQNTNRELSNLLYEMRQIVKEKYIADKQFDELAKSLLKK